jgi:uroporphyrinogen decarboxylase
MTIWKEPNMLKREVVRSALQHKKVPYVPWNMGFTYEAVEKLREHYGKKDIESELENHFLSLGDTCGYFEPIGDECYRDAFGVVWDKSVDKDIGIVKGCQIPEPTLKGYKFPDPLAEKYFKNAPRLLKDGGDGFRVFSIGFSLYERAWTLRGMENILMDFYENPEFVREFLNAIADYNLAQVRKALTYDIDAIYFGDDWGSQRGLLMGAKLWREFIKPVIARMYGEVRKNGKFVMIHSCGKVDELFDDLIEVGLSCFNPFQPEVMDTAAIMKKYKGRLAFHGGLSTQKTLPFGTVEDVRKEVKRLIGMGMGGGYIFAPAHAVEGDVPVENLVAMIETVKGQEGYEK